MQPIERTITANGLAHHILEWDGALRDAPLHPNNDTTILCLHGFLDLSWGFSWVAEALAARGYHVVAPDLRGHGDSERIGAGGYYHFFDYVADLYDLAEGLRRERLVIVGHSMGGSIASYFAGAFPELLYKLVIMEGIMAPEGEYEEMPARMSKWINTTRMLGRKPIRSYSSIEEAAQRLRALDQHCTEERARFLAEKGTRATPEGVVFKHDPLHLSQGPYPFRLESAIPFWKNISCPILMVEGAESFFLQLPGVELRYASFPAHQRVQIPNAGHMMIRHTPDEVASHIINFLQGDNQ